MSHNVTSMSVLYGMYSEDILKALSGIGYVSCYLLTIGCPSNPGFLPIVKKNLEK